MVSAQIRKFVVPLRMSSFISMQELGQLFSNIDLLMSANQSMLKQMLPLRNVPAIDAMIGNIFSAEVEYLIQAYTHYCLNQTTATATYSNLMKKSKFRSFVEKMWTDPECRGLDMLAFIVKPGTCCSRQPGRVRFDAPHRNELSPRLSLLLPTFTPEVQRICKYPLLLRVRERQRASYLVERREIHSECAMCVNVCVSAGTAQVHAREPQ